MANDFPMVRPIDAGKANRNALTQALQTQQFLSGIKASKAAARQLGLQQQAVTGRGTPEGEAAIAALAGESPEAATSTIDAIMKLGEPEREEAKRKANFLGKSALGILAAPPQERPALYEAALASANAQGFDTSNYPAQYSPEVDPQLQTVIGQAMTVAQQIDDVNIRTGRNQEITKLQRAQELALSRGNTKQAAEIQKKIDKITAPAIGRTQFDPQLPTGAAATRSQQVVDDSEFTLGMLDQLEEVIASKNLGAVGDVREFFQGIGQQLEAMSDVLVDHAIQHDSDLNLGVLFGLDPNLSGQRLLENILAYRLALANNPDGRISDPDFKAAQRALGFDKILTGAGDIQARLNQFRRLINKQKAIAEKRLGRKPVEDEPKETKDTGALATDYPEGTRTKPNKDGVVMEVRNGQWVIVNE